MIKEALVGLHVAFSSEQSPFMMHKSPVELIKATSVLFIFVIMKLLPPELLQLACEKQFPFRTIFPRFPNHATGFPEEFLT
jgi:hypothetical protein